MDIQDKNILHMVNTHNQLLLQTFIKANETLGMIFTALILVFLFSLTILYFFF